MRNTLQKKPTTRQLLHNICIILSGMLLATSGTAEVYYIHSNHLATPQVLTDQNQNVVWSSVSKPFGNTTTSGKVTFNLRFPGQYLDPETTLHYNYHRYYDTYTGRYITPDPIGLAGGLNTYGYVVNNPLNFVDPEGNEKRTYGQRIIDVPDGSPLIEGQYPLAREPVVNGLIGLATLAAPPLSGGRLCPLIGGAIGKGVTNPTRGQTVFRVYGGDSLASGASWSPVNPSKLKNFRGAAGLPSGGASAANNTGRFVIEGTLENPSKVVLTRSALPLDGNKGGIPEYIIPNALHNGAVKVNRVSGVNPEF